MEVEKWCSICNEFRNRKGIFCFDCGCKLMEVEKWCGICNVSNYWTNKFCGDCGNKLEKRVTSSNNVPASNEVETHIIEKEDAKTYSLLVVDTKDSDSAIIQSTGETVVDASSGEKNEDFIKGKKEETSQIEINMAGNKSFFNNMSDMLECGICMGDLENPKGFPCQHTFCKECIDRMLKFNVDGSASLSCPMRCDDGDIFIGEYETTNRLSSPYQLKGILDMYKEQNQKSDLLQHKYLCDSAECTKKSSLYCVHCHHFYCSTCKCGDKEHNNSYIEVKFSARQNELVAICNRHDTIATYTCCENKLICVYCLHRNHKGHKYESLIEQTKRIRELAANEKQGAGNIESIMENAKRNLELTKSNITIFRESLDKILTKRKLEYISKHVSIAEADGKRLLKEFDDLVTTHLTAYPDLTPNDLLRNVVEMEDMELFMKTELINDELVRFKSAVLSLQINLSKPAYKNPYLLGKFCVVEGRKIAIGDAQNVSSVSSNFPVPDVIEDVKHLLQNLKDLLNECHFMPTSEEESVDDGDDGGDDDNLVIHLPQFFIDTEEESVDCDDDDDGIVGIHFPIFTDTEEESADDDDDDDDDDIVAMLTEEESTDDDDDDDSDDNDDDDDDDEDDDDDGNTSDGCTVYVGSLSYGATEVDIEDIFEDYGFVREVNIIKDRNTGNPRGFAFVKYYHKAFAEAAITGAHGEYINGRAITCSKARPRGGRGCDGSRGGPGYSGGRGRWRRGRGGLSYC